MLLAPMFEGIFKMEFNLSNPEPSNRPRVITQNESSKAHAYWTIQDLRDLYATAPDDVVMGFVSPNLTMLQGKPGSGKSIVALEMVTAYTTGTPFLGVPRDDCGHSCSKSKLLLKITITFKDSII